MSINILENAHCCTSNVSNIAAQYGTIVVQREIMIDIGAAQVSPEKPSALASFKRYQRETQIP